MDNPVMRTLSTAADLILLNLLTLLCSLPLITIGAALTALNVTTIKIVRGEETAPVKDYFLAFRENFKKGAVKGQIARFHELQDLIREGDYYRLNEGSAWEMVSEDKSEALLSFVLVNPTSNPKPNHIRLKGLDPNAQYQVAWADFHESGAVLPHDAGRTFTGAALMHGGYTLPILFGDYPSVQILWKQD